MALGPTGDGGYWTLAAGAYQPALVRDIDWDAPDVYDQTFQRAAEAGLTVCPLPAWHDVDLPEDVDALRRRLRDLPHSVQSSPTTEPLKRLADRLDELCPPLLPRTDAP